MDKNAENEVRLKSYQIFEEIINKSWLRFHDGFGSFCEELWNEIDRNITKELRGEKEPYYTINPRESIYKLWNRRIKNFYRKETVRKATLCPGSGFINGQPDVFEVSGKKIISPEISQVGAVLATAVYPDEIPSGFSQSPEDIYLHKELNSKLLKAIDEVPSRIKFKNGQMYREVLLIVYHHMPVNGSKSQLIDIISQNLGISRQKAAQLKHHALRILRRLLARDYELASAQKHIRKARRTAKLFVVLSVRIPLMTPT